MAMNEEGHRPVMQAFEGLDIPELLHASVERHTVNLARLVASLKSAGMTESQIDAGVATIVESYKAELLVAIRTIVGVTHA